jgi:quercetin dioxygenase-like cupin family protein
MEHDRYLEMAALHSLDLLEDSDRSDFEQHLAGCEICRAELSGSSEVAASIGLTISPQDPPPELRDRLFDRIRSGPQIWKSWTPRIASHMHVVREGEGEWERVVDGVYAKRLFVDAEHDRVTMLVRMDPGAKYIPHRHGGPEQCFVLEGDIRDGDDVFHAGDFQCLMTGSRHGAQSSESGCLVLIVSSLNDELLPE